jgi:pyridoxamine 5'-phosphate oxidase family protein
MFTENEVAYLRQQRLARIATVSETGQPDVAPVGYTFDGEYFYVGGRDIFKTYKYKNIQSNAKVALVVDDLESVDPWRPRNIKIHGRADVVEREKGYMGAGTYIRIKPERKWSWGLKAE